MRQHCSERTVMSIPLQGSSQHPGFRDSSDWGYIRNFCRSNHLSDRERTVVQEAIARVGSIIAAYDSAIEALTDHDNPTKLHLERDHVLSYQQFCESTLAPIRRISIEILECTRCSRGFSRCFQYTRRHRIQIKPRLGRRNQIHYSIALLHPTIYRL